MINKLPKAPQGWIWSILATVIAGIILYILLPGSNSNTSTDTQEVVSNAILSPIDLTEEANPITMESKPEGAINPAADSEEVSVSPGSLNEAGILFGEIFESQFEFIQSNSEMDSEQIEKFVLERIGVDEAFITDLNNIFTSDNPLPSHCKLVNPGDTLALVRSIYPEGSIISNNDQTSYRVSESCPPFRQVIFYFNDSSGDPEIFEVTFIFPNGASLQTIPEVAERVKQKALEAFKNYEYDVFASGRIEWPNLYGFRVGVDAKSFYLVKDKEV